MPMAFASQPIYLKRPESEWFDSFTRVSTWRNLCGEIAFPKYSEKRIPGMLGLITTQFELLVAVKRAIGYNKLRGNGDFAAANRRQEAVRKA